VEFAVLLNLAQLIWRLQNRTAAKKQNSKSEKALELWESAFYTHMWRFAEVSETKKLAMAAVVLPVRQ